MHSIEVAFRDERLDSAGISLKNAVLGDLGILGLEKVRCTESYYLEIPLDAEKLREIAGKVFADPIVQSYSVDGGLLQGFDFVIEVRLHPDVTDNLAIVTHEAVEDFLGYRVRGKIRSGRRYYLSGKISEKDAQRIAREMLANGMVETYTVRGGMGARA